MKIVTLRLLGILGVVLYIPLLCLTFIDPHTIEQSAHGFIERKLSQETQDKIESYTLPPVTKLEQLLGERAKAMRAETENKLQAIKRQLKNDWPEMMAAELAKLRNLDCECRKKWQDKIRASLEMQQLSLEVVQAKLIDFSHAKYMDIVQKLTRDIRIFLGANATVFLLLLGISLLKPVAVRHLFLPAGLLLLSSVICSYFYLFEQNWFYTIIYNDYTGYAYLAYLLLVFSFLTDIVLNRARVTSEILNLLCRGISDIGSFSPC
jgi:hypothetical protein